MRYYLVAGQDATEAFFSLHRQEVLQKPQYKRLQVGSIKGESSKIKPLAPGELSQVPYAEPTWLAQGFHSPYYNEVYQTVISVLTMLKDYQSHRKFQTKIRKFVDEHIAAEAQVRQPELRHCPTYLDDRKAKLTERSRVRRCLMQWLTKV
jgi:hypothetical protein